MHLQFSSVAQSCPTLCDPMNRSTPGLPVHHQLPESTQTHVHWVGDAIQPSHPLSSPSPPALNLFQYQGLFIFIFFLLCNLSLYLFIFFNFFFFFLICSEFCHTLKWKGLGLTCLPHPDPPSHLPPHPLRPGQFFTSCGQNTGVSASTSVLPMNTQYWFLLGRTGWISLQSRTLKSLLQHHSLNIL